MRVLQNVSALLKTIHIYTLTSNLYPDLQYVIVASCSTGALAKIVLVGWEAIENEWHGSIPE